MAQRTNTLEYAFATSTAALTAATRLDFAAITVDVSENTSRTFRSVYLEIYDRGTETTATSLTSWLIGIKIDAVAASDATVTSTMVNTGDQQSLVFTRDVTSYFVTNFTGTSHSVQASVQFGALGTINIACRLLVTYEYDDAAQTTRTKTVRIPIESGTTTLTATLAEIGTYQIPAVIPNWQAVTADNTTETFTATAHGLSNGMEVVFRNSGGALPAGLSADPVFYYVIGVAANTFQVSTTRGGSALNITSNGTGTNSVSANYVLPEDTITIKDMFFDVMANEGHASGTTDDQLGLQLDAEAETLFGSLEEALDTSCFMRLFWKRTDMTTNIPHAFRARGTTTGRLAQLAAILTITYTYNHTNSTTILNSLMMPMPTESGAIGGTAAGNQSKVQKVFLIEEPTTITLKQSAILFAFNAGAIAISGLNLAVGGQTSRAYTPQTNNNSPAGIHTVLHRFDSGGAAGSGISLARGENTLAFAWYRTSSGTAAVGAGSTAVAILNYTSGKASGGAATHNHTTLWMLGSLAAVGTTSVFDYAGFAPNVPESAYWVTSVGYQMLMDHTGKGLIDLAAERLSGEGVADGWRSVESYNCNAANELSTWIQWPDATDMYDRHPGELDTNRFALETSRVHRVTSFFDPTTAHCGWTSLIMALTYHSITSTVSGSVTGYAGGGGSIVVTAHRVDTGEPLYQATTASGGGYSLTAYDTTIPLFATAREGTNHSGRSNDDFTPT